MLSETDRAEKSPKSPSSLTEQKPSKPSLNPEEERQQQALEDYQKLGFEDDNSVDIFQKP
ncbi:MAG: hypothetical protein ACM37W_20360 [Actinomycetota bacterium]